MADEIDKAQEAADIFTQQSLQEAKSKAAQIPEGNLVIVTFVGIGQAA